MTDEQRAEFLATYGIQQVVYVPVQEIHRNDLRLAIPRLIVLIPIARRP